MIPRTLFKPGHEKFCRNMRRFLGTEYIPHRERREEQQHVDRALWNRAGSLGMLWMTQQRYDGKATVITDAGNGLGHGLDFLKGTHS